MNPNVVKLLEQIKLAVVTYPTQVDMANWTSRHLYLSDNVESIHGCGTAGCIAAWAVGLSEGKTMTDVGRKYPRDIQHQAAELLGIDPVSNALFSVGCWPIKFATAYIEAKTTATRAKVVADRLEHFIQTEGRE